MKMIQERFDRTIDLIRSHGGCFSFLQNLLCISHSTVLVFSFFRGPSVGNQRRNILAACELRSQLLQGRGSIGTYALLLAGLRSTQQAHICVSLFITEAGTFTIFSDFGREELIGALFEPKAPLDTPVFSHLFMNGLLLSRERE